MTQCILNAFNSSIHVNRFAKVYKNCGIYDFILFLDKIVQRHKESGDKIQMNGSVSGSKQCYKMGNLHIAV
jgi:hypothetical protein